LPGSLRTLCGAALVPFFRSPRTLHPPPWGVMRTQVNAGRNLSDPSEPLVTEDVAAGGWTLVVYGFLALWVVVVDTVVAEQQHAQQQHRVTSAASASSSPSANDADGVARGGVAGKAAYLALYL
jgi:hypothetical protein